jgi:arsenate reductase
VSHQSRPPVQGLFTDGSPYTAFACVHHAGRFQKAAGWLRHLADDTVEVRSAGSGPAETIDPAAVEAMAGVGIDITGALCLRPVAVRPVID